MKIKYTEEINLVKGILEKSGFPAEDAAVIAKVISHSDFTGVYSHGLSRLTRYLRQIKVGALNNRPDFKTVLDDKGVTVFDCDNGSGIVSLNKAYDVTLAKAREYGIAISVGRRNANIGCGSYYGWRAAEDNMIGIFCCNTYAFTAPYGGAARLMGTNPIIAAIPADSEYPIVLDISTTCVAMGKIQAYERDGKKIPLNWASDYDGNPTDDPARAYALTPIAAHKGYGLAVVVDALSTFLSGAAYGSDIGLFSELALENTGFFMMLLDPSRFMPLDLFKKNTDRYVRMMKESRKAPGFDEIFLPGEIEHKNYEKFLETGIEVSDALQRELTELSKKLGAEFEGDSFGDLLKYFCE